jgi:hypothetical protein
MRLSFLNLIFAIGQGAPASTEKKPGGLEIARVLCSDSEWNDPAAGGRCLALAGASPWLQLSWVAASPLAALVRLCHRLSPAGPPRPPRAARAGPLSGNFEAGPHCLRGWPGNRRTRRSAGQEIVGLEDPSPEDSFRCLACGQGPVNRRLPHAARSLSWFASPLASHPGLRTVRHALCCVARTSQQCHGLRRLCISYRGVVGPLRISACRDVGSETHLFLRQCCAMLAHPKWIKRLHEWRRLYTAVHK